MTRITLSPRQIYERSITENDVLRAIRQLLEANGARVHRIIERIPWGKTTSEPGFPDLCGWWPEELKPGSLSRQPLFFFIEVKKPGGKLRPAQSVWLLNAQNDGVIAFKADSVEEMVSEFAKFGITIKGL